MTDGGLKTSAKIKKINMFVLSMARHIPGTELLFFLFNTFSNTF